MSLPRKLIISSVVRGTQQGDSHGGLYVVDLETGAYDQPVDWNTFDIDWEGRGADRGLRGIAIQDDKVFVAASDELFVFAPTFELINSYRNPFLKHCHEIWLFDGLLFLTSTGYDSLLVFDPRTEQFISGLAFRRGNEAWETVAFDPNSNVGPAPGMALHLNSVYVDENGIFLAGRKFDYIIQVGNNEVGRAAQIPFWTHNARPFGKGILFNDTASDRLCYQTPEKTVSLELPKFDPKELSNMDADESGLARPGFGRGLCPLSDHIVAAGSSPTTVSLYDLKAEKRLKSITLTNDVRNAAHGMAVWPF